MTKRAVHTAYTRKAHPVHISAVFLVLAFGGAMPTQAAANTAWELFATHCIAPMYQFAEFNPEGLLDRGSRDGNSVFFAPDPYGGSVLRLDFMLSPDFGTRACSVQTVDTQFLADFGAWLTAEIEAGRLVEDMSQVWLTTEQVEPWFEFEFFTREDRATLLLTELADLES